MLALTGLWALLRADEESRDGSVALRPWLLHGAALALLPWLHSRFALLAAAFGSLILLRLGSTKNPAAKAVAFLSIPAISAVLWAGFFVAIYGRPDPSAPHGPGGNVGVVRLRARWPWRPALRSALRPAHLRAGRSRCICRPGGDVLPTAFPASRPGTGVRDHAYLVTVTHFAMWWGGSSPPARFFAPVLPLFAIPAAAAWTFATRRVTKVLAAISLVLTALTR